jgi:hypothetical protein
MLSPRGPVQSIIRAFPYLGKGSIVILAAVAIITSGLSVATTSSASSEGSLAEIVDRTTKGDRLPLCFAPAGAFQLVGIWRNRIRIIQEATLDAR